MTATARGHTQWAKLYEPLREAFETAQPVRIDELKKQIDDFSDVDFLFSWSP
jgi:hypothetical protein